MLAEIFDRRTREKIRTIINRLAEDPEKQGEVLLGELAGFRSFRAVGQRYCLLYTGQDLDIVVVVVAVGLRREGAKDDIYNFGWDC